VINCHPLNSNLPEVTLAAEVQQKPTYGSLLWITCLKLTAGLSNTNLSTSYTATKLEVIPTRSQEMRRFHCNFRYNVQFPSSQFKLRWRWHIPQITHKTIRYYYDAARLIQTSQIEFYFKLTMHKTLMSQIELPRHQNTCRI
jgi:hypothetical protein